MILIADSGSTKTDWCLIDKNEVVLRVQTKGMNPYFQSEEEIVEEPVFEEVEEEPEYEEEYEEEEEKEETDKEDEKEEEELSDVELPEEYQKISYSKAVNLQRYEDYRKENPTLSLEDVVWMVNANQDKPKYNYDIPVSGYDDICIIVNKYYKKVVRPTETCELFEREEAQ